jgi:hypothetical protein
VSCPLRHHPYEKQAEELEVFPELPYLQRLMDARGRMSPSLMSCDRFKLTKESFIDGCSGIRTTSKFIDLREGSQIILS